MGIPFFACSFGRHSLTLTYIILTVLRRCRPHSRFGIFRWILAGGDAGWFSLNEDILKHKRGRRWGSVHFSIRILTNCGLYCIKKVNSTCSKQKSSTVEYHASITLIAGNSRWYFVALCSSVKEDHRWKIEIPPYYPLQPLGWGRSYAIQLWKLRGNHTGDRTKLV